MAEKSFGVRLSANVDSYVAAMARAKGATESMSATSTANFAKVGSQMQRVGGQMTRAVTLPIAAAGVAAVKMSMDYEAAFGRMVGLAGVTASEVDDLKASVLDLAGRTAQSPRALAEALYQASSSGLDTAQAMEAVTVAAEAAAVGMGNASDIVGLVASAVASYGSANIDAARATDILTAAIREGRADPEELAGSLGRVLPIASQLGVSFEEVGGATAYLSNVFGDTNRTVTALQGFLVKLVSPSKQGRDALKDMGTSMAELQAAIDQDGLMGALDLLREHGFADNQVALRSLFDDIEGFQGALALLNDESGKLTGTMDAVADSAGSLSEAFEAKQGEKGFAMAQAWSELQVALIQAGDVIMPVIAGIAGAIGDLADKFSGLSDGAQIAVIGLLAVFAAIGPIIAIAGTLVKNFLMIRAALIALKTAMLAHPLLAFATVALAVGAAVGLMGDDTESAATAVLSLRDAMKAAKSEGEGFAAWLLTMAESGHVGLAGAMAEAGVTIEELAAAASAGGEAFDAMRLRILEAAKATGLGDEQLTALNAVLSGLPITAAAASQELAILNQISGESGEATSRSASLARDGADALGQYGDAASAAAEGVGELADVDVEGFWDDWRADVAAAETALWQQAIETATGALNDQITALEENLAAQMALVDFARGAADAQYALADSTDGYNRFLEELPGKLDEIGESEDSQAEKQRQTNALYREAATLAASMADDVVDAYNEAADGSLTAAQKGDLWRQTMLDGALAASGPARDAILDYAFAVNEIPPEKQTLIEAAIAAGDLATAIGLLNGASETRKAEIQADLDEVALDRANTRLEKMEDPLTAKVTVTADTSAAIRSINALRLMTPGGVTFGLAEGGFINRPIVSKLGEGGLPEVVLPLTRPGRMRDLINDSRVGGPILAALGAVGSAGGRTINLTHTTIPAPTMPTAPAVVSGGSSGSSVDDAQRIADKLQQRMFDRDRISLAEYRAYLEARRSTLAEFSDEETELWSKIQQLDEQERRANEAAAAAAQKAADDVIAAEEKAAAAAQKAADEKAEADAKNAAAEEAQRAAVLAQQDAIQKYLVDSNQISLADYQNYLAGRRSGFQMYSSEWFALTAQILAAQKELDAAALNATKVLFDQADAAKALSEATHANIEADAAFNAAAAHAWAVGADKDATPEERASADADLARSATQLADTAYRLHDAQANSRGWDDGTPEWARFMRERLTADSVWNAANGRANVANAIDRWLVGIPAFAAGGYVPATKNGRIVRVAEGGKGEFIGTGPQMQSMFGVGTGTTAVTYQITIDAPPTYDKARGARDIVDMIDRHLRSAGHTPLTSR